MKSDVQKLMQKFKDTDIPIIEAAFVKVYLQKKNIFFENSRFICSYLERVADRDAELYRYIFDSFHFGQIDDLIGIFELLLNSENKKMNGMIYTPYHIKKYIIEHVIVQNEIPKVVDPACGCGSFLLTAAQFLKERYGLSYKEIFGSYIVGFDIDGHSIEKAKVLFNILSLEEEGTSIEEGCELHTVNSLQELSKKTYKNRYDVVIGNPPYVRAKNMEKQVKESVKLWSVVSGNVDLYIPFYQLAVEILKLDGVMGYISPNTFLQSVNGKGLRNYLVGRGYKIAVLDFRETKMFQEISYYTCICLIFKGKSTYDLDYALLNGESSLDKYEFTTYNIKNYPVNKERRFGNSRIDDIIRRIESQPHRLEDYKIRNGLATLKNDLYFLRLREWTTTTITERTEERRSP